MEDKMWSLLESHKLTEFDRGSGPPPYISKWCQSGAQAGWGPDIEEVRVEERGKTATILNDIYSERVIKLAKGLRDLGYKVTLSFEPASADMLQNLGLSHAMVKQIESEG